MTQAQPHLTPSPAPPGPIHVVVDLNRCQAYAQCCFFAPSVFKLHGEEALCYDPAPDEAQLKHVLRPREPWGDFEGRLGVAATGLDLPAKQVRLADGHSLAFDRLLIATGTRARPWSNQAEAKLEGVLTLRGRDDAKLLQQHLAAKPRRVLVIGGGFTGSEIASDCCELGLPVTVVERGAAPLVGALGGVIAERVATLQRQHGVDLRCQVTVTSLQGDAQGRVRRAQLSDGSSIDTEVAVLSQGAMRNTEWLRDAWLAVGAIGVGSDAGSPAFAIDALVTDDIFVA